MKKINNKHPWDVEWTERDNEAVKEWLEMFKDIPKEDITKHYTEVKIMANKLIRTTFLSFMKGMEEFISKEYNDYALTNVAIKHSFDHFLLVNKTAIDAIKKLEPDFDKEVFIQKLKDSFQGCLDILKEKLK